MVEMMLAPSSKRVASRLNQSFSFLLLSVVISLCFDRAKAFFHTDKQTFKPRETTAAGSVAKLLRFFSAPRSAGRASAATTIAPGDNLLLQL